jgi:hypothetical protein
MTAVTDALNTVGKFMVKFYLWVPVLIALHIIASKLSIVNQAGNNKAAAWMWVIGALPIWIAISRYSTHILFDAMLYDTLLVIVYTIGIAYFGNSILTITNMIGIGLMFAGLVMVKL